MKQFDYSGDKHRIKGGHGNMKRFIFLAIVLIPFTSVFSQQLSRDEIFENLEAIYQISDDSNRLNSYDQLAASLGFTRNGQISEDGHDVESKWEVSVQADPMDDSKKIFFVLPADTASSYDNVALLIRYQNGSTDLFVAWDEYLSDNNRVTIRFDSEDAYTEFWSPSSNKTASFCKDPVSFINKVATHDTLVMRITPYNEGPKTAVFDIRGLKQAALPYNNDLKWF